MPPADPKAAAWLRVSFAADCAGGDENEPGDECSVCGLNYPDGCECPGPTQDGYEYREIDGVLYARPLPMSLHHPQQPEITSMAKITETTPKGLRTFTVELNEDELRLIVGLVGGCSGRDCTRAGLPQQLSQHLYEQLCPLFGSSPYDQHPHFDVAFRLT